MVWILIPLLTTDGVPIIMYQPMLCTNWAKVVSIRISLLVATIDDNLTAQPHCLLASMAQQSHRLTEESEESLIPPLPCATGCHDAVTC